MYKAVVVIRSKDIKTRLIIRKNSAGNDWRQSIYQSFTKRLQRLNRVPLGRSNHRKRRGQMCPKPAFLQSVLSNANDRRRLIAKPIPLTAGDVAGKH